MTALLVASSGGHLKQLHRLRPRLEGIDGPATWVTFDTAQARSLLADEDVVFVHRQDPRDVRACSRNLRRAASMLLRRRYNDVVSTGAGVALAFLPTAAALGARCHYIESATRVDGPSLTGRALRWWPGVTLYTQYRSWAGERWNYSGSVFDGFSVDAGPPRPVRRAVVTVGTLDAFGFPRLLRQLTGIIPPDVEVLWQTGATTWDGAPGTVRASVPAAELQKAMEEADVVVAHAGTGSALAAIEAGRCPVLVPRRAAHGEHVDDHQLQIATELHERGLALHVEPEDLTLEVLERAAGRSARPASALSPFMLR